ncbi:MAG: hypothetical protein WKG00_31860 [Polyangiaceae bacterium]
MAGPSAWCPTGPSASASAALLLLVLLGCTNDYDGLMASAAASSGSSSSASSGGAGGSTSSASSTGGPGGAAGGSGGAASSTAAGPGGSGGVGGSTGGAGGQPPRVTIECAGAQCTGGQVCCIEDQLPSGFDADCKDAAACDAVQALCDGTEDCDGGQVCCGHYQQNGDYTQIECEPTCNGDMQLEMCHGSADACVSGTSCEASDNLGSPWGYCSD